MILNKAFLVLFCWVQFALAMEATAVGQSLGVPNPPGIMAYGEISNVMGPTGRVPPLIYCAD